MNNNNPIHNNNPRPQVGFSRNFQSQIQLSHIEEHLPTYRATTILQPQQTNLLNRNLKNRLVFINLCDQYAPFKISDKYQFNRIFIDKGPDSTMPEWNLLLDSNQPQKTISKEDWQLAQSRLVSIAEQFDDKIKLAQVGEQLKPSVLVHNFFALVLKVQDAKTREGQNYIRQRVCAIVDHICLQETNPDDPKYIGEKGMQNLQTLIELFAQAGEACPDRAIVFLEKAEIQVKILKSPKHLFNILFNSFKRQMIELTFMDFKNKENIESILYELNRFNDLLSLGAKANMLYEAYVQRTAKPLSLEDATKKLLQAFNKEALISFFSQYPEIEEAIGATQSKDDWTGHIQDLQDWAEGEKDDFSPQKIEAFRQLFASKFRNQDFSSTDKLKEIINNQGIGGDCEVLWMSLYDIKNDPIHESPYFKNDIEEKLLEKLAEAQILIPLEETPSTEISKSNNDIDDKGKEEIN